MIPYRTGHRAVIWPLGFLPLLLAFAGYTTASRHFASEEATLETMGFIRNLNDLLSTLQDAETGQRGYLLTGEARYLKPFQQANAQLATRLSETSKAAIRNGVAPSEIATLNKLIDSKMKELRDTVELRRTVGLVPALAIARSAAWRSNPNSQRRTRGRIPS